MHAFILTPGCWLGEGTVSFTASPEVLKFYTRWDVSNSVGGIVACKQSVEMQEHGETVNNAFCITELNPTSFKIELSNDVIGTVTGKGIIDEKAIAWEFRSHENFEGYEVYELQENGDYLLHAEYSSPEQFRTIIDGRIWKKAD